jgi:hypothetical protein
MVCAVGTIGVVGIIGFPAPSLSTGGNWPFEGVGVGEGVTVLVGVGVGSTGVVVGSGVGEKEGVGNVGGLLTIGATPAGFFFFFPAQPSTEPKTTNTVNNSEIHFNIIFSSTTVSTSVKSIYSYSTRNIRKLCTCGLPTAKNMPLGYRHLNILYLLMIVDYVKFFRRLFDIHIAGGAVAWIYTSDLLGRVFGLTPKGKSIKTMWSS